MMMLRPSASSSMWRFILHWSLLCIQQTRNKSSMNLNRHCNNLLQLRSRSIMNWTHSLSISIDWTRTQWRFSSSHSRVLPIFILLSNSFALPIFNYRFSNNGFTHQQFSTMIDYLCQDSILKSILTLFFRLPDPAFVLWLEPSIWEWLLYLVHLQQQTLPKKDTWWSLSICQIVILPILYLLFRL